MWKSSEANLWGHCKGEEATRKLNSNALPSSPMTQWGLYVCAHLLSFACSDGFVSCQPASSIFPILHQLEISRILGWLDYNSWWKQPQQSFPVLFADRANEDENYNIKGGKGAKFEERKKQQTESCFTFVIPIYSISKRWAPLIAEVRSAEIQSSCKFGLQMALLVLLVCGQHQVAHRLQI